MFYHIIGGVSLSQSLSMPFLSQPDNDLAGYLWLENNIRVRTLEQSDRRNASTSKKSKYIPIYQINPLWRFTNIAHYLGLSQN